MPLGRAVPFDPEALSARPFSDFQHQTVANGKSSKSFAQSVFQFVLVVAPRHRAGPMPYSFLHIAALRNDVVKAQQLIDGEVLCAPARLWAR